MSRIEAGVDPWIAYRDFLEDWTYLPGIRLDLVVDGPQIGNRRHVRWAALLAATTEALCRRDGIAVPSWTNDPRYRLHRPWYLYDGAERMRAWLRESSPREFASRNIWSGDRLLRRT